MVHSWFRNPDLMVRYSRKWAIKVGPYKKRPMPFFFSRISLRWVLNFKNIGGVCAQQRKIAIFSYQRWTPISHKMDLISIGIVPIGESPLTVIEFEKLPSISHSNFLNV